MRKRLVTIFNDADVGNIRSLRAGIARLPGIEKLAHQPDTDVGEVGGETVEAFRKIDLIPTLLFIDPWGYKGLSLGLIESFLKNWGCECIFFLQLQPNKSRRSANEAVKEAHGCSVRICSRSAPEGTT